MKMNKKITAMILSAVIAAAPVAAPVMEVQTVAAATTTTKTLKNTWSKDGRYYYDQNGRKVTGVKKIGRYTYVFAKNGRLVTNRPYYVRPDCQLSRHWQQFVIRDVVTT